MSEEQFTLNLMKKPSEIEMDGKMISKYDVVRLLNEQQDTISRLEEENEQLKKDVENLQEVVAEFGATLLTNGFEIEINDVNLSEVIDDDCYCSRW